MVRVSNGPTAKGVEGMGPLPERQLELLKRFVLRARLVQDHSLAGDLLELRKLAKVEIKAVLARNTITGETKVSLQPVDLIPTEQLESAAARVRPIFLKSDGVQYENVLDAVNTVLKGRSGASELRAKATELRTSFRNADPDYPHGKPRDLWDGGVLSHKQLAGSWLYGNLLHEDEIRRSYGGKMALEEMYVAAMRTVASEMLAAVETLHLIERLQTRGWLELPDGIFTDEVTVSATSWVPPGKVTLYVAPVNTPIPSDLDADVLSSDGWKNAVDEYLPGQPNDS